MYDFFEIIEKESKKRGNIESISVLPRFIINHKTQDLMIRGSDFYAVWDETTGLWSTSEGTVIDIVDREIRKRIEEIKQRNKDTNIPIYGQYMKKSDSGSIDSWHKYVQKQSRDRYEQLDSTLTFQNTEVKKEDHVSKRLGYSLSECDIPAYEELISTLYDADERKKIEWAIGSIISGDSKHIQKFLVFYGSAGTGKSTVLNIIQDLFDGYYAMFDAKNLASRNNDFALEDFKSNPLVAIQHDGDLSRVEDNTKLNSIVSHETMVVNEKFKSKYSAKFNSFIFMGTNRPVQIREGKSGLTRRLIDVHPTGTKIPYRKYNQLTKAIKYELGGIAYHCLQVYQEMGDDYYNGYVPKEMMAATNVIYNFINDEIDYFIVNDPLPAAAAWNRYTVYCKKNDINYIMEQQKFKEELKSYYHEFYDRLKMEDGSYPRKVYARLKYEMFMDADNKSEDKEEKKGDLNLKEQPSLFDFYCSNCPAQYASKKETPTQKWEDVTTKLGDLDTSKVHYVKVPENHIVIDFDLKDETGKKSYEKNMQAALFWPATYTELSKSGAGIHLHYIYDGDTSKLSSIYSEGIEIKSFPGNSSLRRKLTKCNNVPIAHISSNLPLKEEKMVNSEVIQNEKHLRRLIEKCLRKENHGATAPEVDFIKKILDEAYESGLEYDVSDLKQKVGSFALNSTNQSEKCLKTVSKMHFKSADKEEVAALTTEYKSDKYVIFDVESAVNFFGVAWKFYHEPHVTKMYNPTPEEIEELVQYKLIGYNNRRYDNHMLYARMQGYTVEELFNLSQRIIDKRDKNAFFREAYNLSFTDVYDFSATKQSLKKWEIELEEEYNLKHQELGLKWDEPWPEEMWPEVMEYCANDVIATEAVFDHLQADFEAREILCAITESSLNTTTNQNTTKMIVGDAKNPQAGFVYTDLSEMFPGYKFENGVSTYRGEEVGEGGYVYSEPGMYENIALLDIASMHPTSAINLNIFGPYTKNFEELVRARLYIKHGDYDAAGKLFNGKLKPYLKDKAQAKRLAYALKIAINSVYGLTAAKFDNKLRDPRNVDNIVAKRGALFMVDLKHAVQEKGYTVAHIKTDSIKIPNADQEIIDFVCEFGKKYGYTFEHEATYEKMCLVNDAVYIAKYNDGPHEFKLSTNEKLMTPWTATGTQFQVPYVFKTLFSHDPILFKDMCETKSVTSTLYLDMNENLPEEEHDYVFVGRVGLFCPIKPGCGGGILLREKDGKYNAATGTKGYRWLEATTVKALNKQDDVDDSYYRRLVDGAIEALAKYGDVERFISD